MRRSIDIGGKADPALKRAKSIDRRGDLLPTGSTLLNLALSGTIEGGYKKGTLINIVGDSSAGKTFLAWHLFAEIVHDDRFKRYKLVYDDAEGKLQLDIHKLFGKGMERVEKIGSDLIEEFDQNVRKLLKDKVPFVYCLDSFDAVTTKEELAKKEIERDYPLKPRLASEMLRKICGDLEKQSSLLVIISQTREKIGVQFGEKKTRSGGLALRFHSLQEFWLAVKGHIKRKDKEVGVEVACKVKKNHLTGKLRTINFDIVYDIGLDDLSSQIDWLILEGFWVKEKQLIDTGEDFVEATKREMIRKKDLIKYIEKNSLEEKLRELVGVCWREVEKSIESNRKPRYL